MKPRVRVIVVDGRAWPVPPPSPFAARGREWPLPNARNGRLFDTDAFEVLVEDAPFGSMATSRTRGADAVVIINGSYNKQHADTLASARVNGVPVIIALTAGDGDEVGLRRLLRAAGHEGDDAIMLRMAPGTAAAATAADLSAAFDRHIVPRGAGGFHAGEAVGRGRMVIAGEAPIKARGFIAGYDSLTPMSFELDERARAGDDVSRDTYVQFPALMTEPAVSLRGPIVVDFAQAPTPTDGCVAFTSLAEVSARVDGRGRVYARTALPMPTMGPAAWKIGVLVTQAQMRPTTTGDLGANVLVGDVSRDTVLRRPADDDGNVVLERNGERIGFVRVLRNDATRVYIDAIEIDAPHRGQGVGGDVIRSIVDQAPHQPGRPRVSCHVPTSALRFYDFLERCGFEGQKTNKDQTLMSTRW